MNQSTRTTRLGLATGLLAGSLLLAGCSDGMDYSELRVIHASKDAPPVNVRVGVRTPIKELDYGDSSGYVSVRSGKRRLVVEAIIPGGNADVITVKRFKLEKDRRYNVLAVNETANIKPLVVEESAAEPALDQVAVAVVHASIDANEVDIYVTEPGELLSNVDKTFSFDYTDVVDAGALPAGAYQIRATAPGTKNVVYDSGTVDLSGFGGEKLLLAAISTENDTEEATAPIKLLAATNIAYLELPDTRTDTGARVVHLSPDAGLATEAVGGNVEVFATSTALGPNPVELIPAFAYTDIVPGADSFVGVPAGTYVFDVAPDTDSIDDSVYTSPALDLAAGVESTVIAAGNVGGNPDFELLATADDNRSVITQASVKVVHAAPAAGLVDVYVTPSSANFSTDDVLSGAAGEPLLKDFAFADITPYVALPPDQDWDIRVVAGNGALVAINVEDFTLPAGLVGTVIARQTDVRDPLDFGVVVLTNTP